MVVSSKERHIWVEKMVFPFPLDGAGFEIKDWYYWMLIFIYLLKIQTYLNLN